MIIRTRNLAGLVAAVLLLSLLGVTFFEWWASHQPELSASVQPRGNQPASIAPASPELKRSPVLRGGAVQALTVHVVDGSGNPLPEAAIVASQASNVSELIADDAGRGLIEWESDSEGISLSVSAQGFAAAAQEVLAGTSEVVISLQQECRISGRVAADYDVLIENWPIAIVAHSSSVAGAGATPPVWNEVSPLAVTEAGVDGSFALSGLPIDTAYRLSAVGNQLISLPTPQYYLCGEENAEIDVRGLWGVAVRLEFSDGVVIPRALRERAHFEFTCFEPLAPLTHSTEAALIRHHSRKETDGAERLLVFAQLGELSGSGSPVITDLTFSVPGVVGAASVEAALGRLGPDGFPSITIQYPLRSEELLWGEVHLAMVAPESLMPLPLRGTLELIADSGTISIAAQGNHLLPVPVGRYRAGFRAFYGNFRCDVEPEGVVDVLEGERTRLEVKFPEGFGFITIGAAMSGSQPVDGFTGNISRVDPQYGSWRKWMLPFTFSGESGVIGPLRPGAYRVEISEPFSALGGPRRVELGEDQVVSEWFVLVP